MVFQLMSHCEITGILIKSLESIEQRENFSLQSKGQELTIKTLTKQL